MCKTTLCNTSLTNRTTRQFSLKQTNQTNRPKPEFVTEKQGEIQRQE